MPRLVEQGVSRSNSEQKIGAQLMASQRQDTVAKRYARALFDVTEPSNFDRVSEQLKALATVWSSSLDFRQAMLNPRISDAVRLSVMESVVATLGGWASEALRRTLNTFVSLRKVALVPRLSEMFAHLVSEYRKSLSLEVTFASPATEGDVATLQSRLSTSLGGEVSLSLKHDPSLLGGVTIRMGDRLLDRSVAGALQRMAVQITK